MQPRSIQVAFGDVSVQGSSQKLDLLDDWSLGKPLITHRPDLCDGRHVTGRRWLADSCVAPPCSSYAYPRASPRTPLTLPPIMFYTTFSKFSDVSFRHGKAFWISVNNITVRITSLLETHSWTLYSICVRRKRWNIPRPVLGCLCMSQRRPSTNRRRV